MFLIVSSGGALRVFPFCRKGSRALFCDRLLGALRRGLEGKKAEFVGVRPSCLVLRGARADLLRSPLFGACYSFERFFLLKMWSFLLEWLIMYIRNGDFAAVFGFFRCLDRRKSGGGGAKRPLFFILPKVDCFCRLPPFRL